MASKRERTRHPRSGRGDPGSGLTEASEGPRARTPRSCVVEAEHCLHYVPQQFGFDLAILLSNAASLLQQVSFQSHVRGPTYVHTSKKSMTSQCKS